MKPQSKSITASKRQLRAARSSATWRGRIASYQAQRKIIPSWVKGGVVLLLAVLLAKRMRCPYFMRKYPSVAMTQ